DARLERGARMAESPARDVAENAARADPQTLTPDAIDAVVAEFRGWLTALAESPPAPPPADEAPDLYTLLAQFTALRHEVNLQTRATRAQQEHNNETLRQLTHALDALREAQASLGETRERSADERLRPLLKSLVELHDAVALAGREMTRVQEAVLPMLADVVGTVNEDDDAPESASPGSWGSRWFRRPAPADAPAHRQVERP